VTRWKMKTWEELHWLQSIASDSNPRKEKDSSVDRTVVLKKDAERQKSGFMPEKSETGQEKKNKLGEKLEDWPATAQDGGERQEVDRAAYIFSTYRACGRRTG